MPRSWTTPTRATPSSWSRRRPWPWSGPTTWSPPTISPRSGGAGSSSIGLSPGDPGDHLLINASRLPSVRIEGCQVRSHRARAFLIKTRDVLIQDNTIENTTGTAIHVGAEGYWHEGPASADVTIRNNRFLGCGRGEGTIHGASAIAVDVEAPRRDVPGIHRRILIEGNQIVGPGVGPGAERGIYVSGARDVTVRYNEIAGVRVPVAVEHSEGVEVYENADDAALHGSGMERGTP